MRSRAKAPVFHVTNAPKSLRADVRSREVRYLISMGIRTACFVLAFLTSGALRWTLVVLAVVLPYIAVVIANAGRENTKRRVPTLEATFHGPELPSGDRRNGEPHAQRNGKVHADDSAKSGESGHNSEHSGTAPTTSASP